VDIDDDLLERARSVAGTGTIKDTVHAALERLVDDEKVQRHVERLRGSGALDPARIDAGRAARPLSGNFLPGDDLCDESRAFLAGTAPWAQDALSG
jgi:Arc/MetJ family transcription regulator